MLRRILLAGLLLGAAGCSDITGPSGRHSFVVQADSTGFASFNFPAELTSKAGDPPALLCYNTPNNREGAPWYPMSDGYWVEDSPWCALFPEAGDRWGASAVNLEPGWYVAFVLIF
ncbi:MAG: hypothetical protein LBG44_10280 [Gemmatimonadota bacterium]|nr:hypothetical protein [Gemmatimonadota bacterium]